MTLIKEPVILVRKGGQIDHSGFSINYINYKIIIYQKLWYWWCWDF